MPGFSAKLKQALINALGVEGSVNETELENAVTAIPVGDIPLADTKILVGQASGLAAAVSMSGNATIADTGAVTVTSLNGLKVARGVHVQVAAADTVVTGLATVVAVVASFRDAPSVKQMFVEASEGDQAGTPAAGSILISTFKPTSNVNDSTPTAATDFTENKKIGWVAIGT